MSEHNKNNNEIISDEEFKRLNKKQHLTQAETIKAWTYIINKDD